MQAASFPARPLRILYRHELRNLAYVTLDEANGGVVRNLNSHGVGVQAVAALHQKQRVRVRFELKRPRLSLDSQGEVAWADPSGQCGIRFVGLPARAAHQIKEWMFGNLLDSIFRDALQDRPILQAASGSTHPEENDGLILSAAPLPVIQLEPSKVPSDAQPLPLHSEAAYEEDSARPADAELAWLSRPLSARTLALLIDSLIMIAAFLLFSLVFLSITRELPRWPLGLEAAFGAAIFVPAFYCGFTYKFGGATLGARLAQITGSASEDDEKIEEEVRLR
jgi:hypothetical protein